MSWLFWIFLDFICVMFEFEKGSNSNLNLNLISNLFQSLNLLLGRQLPQTARWPI
jgi:hypothetical protein